MKYMMNLYQTCNRKYNYVTKITKLKAQNFYVSGNGLSKETSFVKEVDFLMETNFLGNLTFSLKLAFLEKLCKGNWLCNDN